MGRPELTANQIEELTDRICLAYDDSQPGEALILLMDEIEYLSLTSPRDIESITVIVKDRAYARTQNTEKGQESLLKRLRGELRKVPNH